MSTTKEKQKQYYNANRDRIKEQLLQKQTKGGLQPITTETNTEVQVPTPTSNTNLYSTKLRRLNNYPEWNTDAGIENVINILLSKQKQTKKFEEKYKNFFVGENNGKKELFYGIKAKGDNSENFNVL